MTSRVFRLHSTLELPLDTVHDFFEDPDLPVELADVEITRRNNTLIISAIAAEDNISKYTPTAQLKASVTENRLYENEDGEWVDEPPQDRAPGGMGDGPTWDAFGDGGAQQQQEEINSKLVEYACFKGDLETVLQNTALQYPMFLVLQSLARTAEKGELTAIAAVDDGLEATRIVDGDPRGASIEVVEDPREGQSSGVDWRKNDLIS